MFMYVALPDFHTKVISQNVLYFSCAKQVIFWTIYILKVANSALESQESVNFLSAMILCDQ